MDIYLPEVNYDHSLWSCRLPTPKNQIVSEVLILTVDFHLVQGILVT